MNPQANKRTLWIQALRERRVWLRAMKFGFTAGLLQAAVNQGDFWLRGAVGPAVVLKTIVSPLIGFALVLFTSAATWVQKSVEQSEIT